MFIFYWYKNCSILFTHYFFQISLNFISKNVDKESLSIFQLKLFVIALKWSILATSSDEISNSTLKKEEHKFLVYLRLKSLPLNFLFIKGTNCCYYYQYSSSMYNKVSRKQSWETIFHRILNNLCTWLAATYFWYCVHCFFRNKVTILEKKSKLALKFRINVHQLMEIVTHTFLQFTNIFCR